VRLRHRHGRGFANSRYPEKRQMFRIDGILTIMDFDLFNYDLGSVDALDEADFMPGIDGFIFRIVPSNEEADRLEAEGLEFRSWHPKYRERLEKGAVAACVFVGRDLAYVGWAGLSNEAMRSMGEPPYRFRVDFAGGEACTGSIWTNPAYRGMGLAAYGYFKRLQFLRRAGKETAKSATASDNVATHRMLARFGARLCGKGCLTRFLCLEWWREKPCNDADRPIPSG
jgi:RimJ/RimL family protein N-acetyltransferase